MAGGPLDLTRPLRVARDHVEADVDDETVLMQHTTGSFFSVGSTGRAIWRHLGDGITGAELIDRLAEAYDAPREDIVADTVPFLEDLLRRGLVDQG